MTDTGTIQVDSAKIRSTMQARNLSMVELAERSGITRAGIYQVLEGNRTTLDTVGRLATALGVNPIDLMRIEGFPSPQS